MRLGSGTNIANIGELPYVLRAAAVLAIHLAAVLVLHRLTVFSAAELRLGLVLVPVVLSATAFGGLAAGVPIALAATVSLHIADQPFVSAEGAAVNGAIRLAIFVGIALLVDRVGRRTAGMREQQKQLEREMQVRAEYTTQVAHELRNPLVSIRAAARTLDRHPDPAAMAAGIASESGSALELLDSLNDVASIEAGQLRSALQPMDLAQLARSVVEALQSEEHEVRFTAPPQALAVLGDQQRLAQVLKNLISNAVKYSPSGTPIDVSVRHDHDRARAVLAVRDHGPGIPPPERGQLFQKFARLSTAGGTRGSGLGLYICRAIVRDHNGELTADWPSGGGTMFSVDLPAVGTRVAAVAPAPRPAGHAPRR